MRIGELSRATGVTQRALRYYEEQGLLTPGRTANGYREYGPDAPEAVGRIRALLAMGLPSRLIRDLVPCELDGPHESACAGLLQSLVALRDTQKEQALALTRTIAALEDYLGEMAAAR